MRFVAAATVVQAARIHTRQNVLQLTRLKKKQSFARSDPNCRSIVYKRPNRVAFQLFKCALGRCLLAVKDKEPGAGRSDQEAIGRVFAQTRELAQTAVRVGFRPDQSTLRAL